MSWQTFWQRVADGANAAAAKADAKMQENEARITSGQRIGLPTCLFCTDKRKMFTVVVPFTFAVDRFSRARVRGTVRCDNCGMRLIVMRWADSNKWSWFHAL